MGASIPDPGADYNVPMRTRVRSGPARGTRPGRKALQGVVLAAGCVLAAPAPDPRPWHQPWATVRMRADGRRDTMPKSVRISPDGRLAVVPCMSSNTVVVYSAPDVRHLASIRTPASMPVECTFSDDSRFAFVQCLQPGVLLKVDLQRLEVTGTSRPHGLWPKVVEFTPDRRELWVTAWLGHTVDILDAETLALRARIKVARTPRGIGFLARQPRAYIANFSEFEPDDGTVTEIDTTTRAIIRTFGNLRGAPRHVTVSPDDRFVYVSNMGRSLIHVIDTRSDSIVGEIPAERYPKTTDITSDGRWLYAACFTGEYRPGRVLVWDCRLRRGAGSLPAGRATTGLDVSPDDGFLWVANIGDHTLNVHRIIR